MYELNEEGVDEKPFYEVIEPFVISGSEFDDRHLLGWKRLISFQE